MTAEPDFTAYTWHDRIMALEAVYEAAKKVDLHYIGIAQNRAALHGNDPLYRDYMFDMGPMRELDEAIQRLEDHKKVAG